MSEFKEGQRVRIKATAFDGGREYAVPNAGHIAVLEAIIDGSRLEHWDCRIEATGKLVDLFADEFEALSDLDRKEQS